MEKDFDAMAEKTVLRNMLSKWGILSVEMQTAVSKDEQVPEMKDITEEVDQPDIIDAVPSEEKPSADIDIEFDVNE